MKHKMLGQKLVKEGDGGESVTVVNVNDEYVIHITSIA